MYTLGHLEFFLDEIQKLLNVLFCGGTENSHSGASLLGSYLHDFKHAIEKTLHIFFFLLIFTIIYSTQVLAKRYQEWYKITIKGLFLIVGLYYLIEETYEIVYILFGLIFTGLALSIYQNFKRKNDELLLLSLLALVYLCIGFIGSNVGVYNSRYTLIFPVGLVIGFIFNNHYSINISISLFKFHLNNKILHFIQYSLTILLIIAAIIYQFNYPYHDASKNNLLYPINHPRLVGIYTSRKRASSIQEVIKQIELHTLPGETILSYDSTPLLYYVTQTVPYLSNTWVEIMSPDDVQKAFKERNHLNKKPLVVRAKYDTNNPGWPVLKVTLPLDEWVKNRQLGDNFLKFNNYQKIWENDFFEIYTVVH